MGDTPSSNREALNSHTVNQWPPLLNRPQPARYNLKTRLSHMSESPTRRCLSDYDLLMQQRLPAKPAPNGIRTGLQGAVNAPASANIPGSVTGLVSVHADAGKANLLSADDADSDDESVRSIEHDLNPHTTANLCTLSTPTKPSVVMVEAADTNPAASDTDSGSKIVSTISHDTNLPQALSQLGIISTAADVKIPYIKESFAELLKEQEKHEENVERRTYLQWMVEIDADMGIETNPAVHTEMAELECQIKGKEEQDKIMLGMRGAAFPWHYEINDKPMEKRWVEQKEQEAAGKARGQRKAIEEVQVLKNLREKWELTRSKERQPDQGPRGAYGSGHGIRNSKPGNRGRVALDTGNVERSLLTRQNLDRSQPGRACKKDREDFRHVTAANRPRRKTRGEPNYNLVELSELVDLNEDDRV